MNRLRPVSLALAALLALATLFAGAGAAQAADDVGFPDPAPGTPRHGAPEAQRWVDLQVVFQSLFAWKNDADFDPTALTYDEDGQSVGLLGTFLKPRLVLSPIAEIQILYELELGLNLWSLNDPDQYGTAAPSAFRLAHRELYARGELFDGLLGFQVGYQYFTDPTALFLGHWIGAASAWLDLEIVRLTLSAGQLPDQTFEGIVLESENNFEHDSFVVGVRLDVPLGPWSLALGSMTYSDSQVVGQQLFLSTSSVRVVADYDGIGGGLDAAFQYGVTQNGAQGGDEKTVAWALQAWLGVVLGPVELTLNQLLLSPDDAWDRNDTNGAFFYSAKPRSRTLLLSEDEIRDRSANFDERMGERRGKFFLLRSGLSLTDVTARWRAFDWFVPSLTVGAAFTLQPDNAMGSRYVGTELDLNLGFHYGDAFSFYTVVAALLPGQAVAAFANLHDPAATEPMVLVEASLFAYF